MSFFSLCDPIAPPQTSPTITIAPGCPLDPVTPHILIIGHGKIKLVPI